MATKSSPQLEKLKQKFDEAAKGGDISLLTQESLVWFYTHTKKFVTNIGYNQMKNEGDIVPRPIPGQIFLYQYDPKWKEELPYYDTMPLIIALTVEKDRFWGINVHYLPPKVRMLIFSSLMGTLNNAVYSNNMKLKINWKKALKFATGIGKHAQLKHAVKQYLFGHVKSPFLRIDSTNWEMALFLPLSRFKKMRARDVQSGWRKK